MESTAAPEQTNYDNGNFGWSALADSLGIAGGPSAEDIQSGNNQGDTNQGDTNQGGTNQGGTNQGGTNQGGTNQGSTNQGDTAQTAKKGKGGVIALIVIAALLLLAIEFVLVFRFAVMHKLTEESPAWMLAIAKVLKGKSAEK